MCIVLGTFLDTSSCRYVQGNCLWPEAEFEICFFFLYKKPNPLKTKWSFESLNLSAQLVTKH